MSHLLDLLGLAVVLGVVMYGSAELVKARRFGQVVDRPSVGSAIAGWSLVAAATMGIVGIVHIFR